MTENTRRLIPELLSGLRSGASIEELLFEPSLTTIGRWEAIEILHFLFHELPPKARQKMENRLELAAKHGKD